MDDPTVDSSRAADHAERSGVPAQMREVLVSLKALADARLSAHRISYKQGEPLRHLNGASSRSVSELASAVGIDTGAMTRMLERLEAKGLVERHRSPIDRRVVEVRLLAPGARIASQVDALLASVSEDHLSGFSREERTQLRGLLERMRVNGRLGSSR